MYYLGIGILIIVSVQLVLFVYEQMRRIRRNSRVFALEQAVLEKQVEGIVAKNVKGDGIEWAWSGWRKFRVQSIVSENSVIKSFYLVPHDGKPLPIFSPGQYLTFKLKVPGISKPVIRCYSLSDSGAQTDYYRVSIKLQIAPLAADGTVVQDVVDGVSSSYFHRSIEEGDILDAKAPAGKFWLDMTEKTPVVLIAGGVGITPMLSMLNTLIQKKSKREVWLFYGVPNVRQLIMAEYLQEITQNNSNVHWHSFFSEPGIYGLREEGDSNHGHITCDAIEQLGAPMAADFYVCGPGPMMDSIVSGLHDADVNADRIHFESFGPATLNRRVTKTEALPAKSGTSIPVTFGVSDKKIDWSEESGTLLEAAEAAGVSIENGCRAGSCGTCLTAVLEGEVGYIEDPDSAVEKGSCLPCIAVPKTKLRLNA
ncbi:hypothetical protein A9Q99_17520 [Gammaproteobacteria bacterium 45_16_T64]|nr:hypothetical protein A9Q99_17520 [Gammaproteobacteria bacterium 45_16_T64]